MFGSKSFEQSQYNPAFFFQFLNILLIIPMKIGRMENNGQDWPNDDYYPNEDLPPNLMNIDLNSFDSSQLRPVPVPLLNSNGTNK